MKTKTRKPSAKTLLKRKFKQFLKDNDALEAYEYNCKHHSFRHIGTKSLNDVIDYYFKENKQALFGDAFSWHDAKEGRDYWWKLSSKWTDIKE
jgi:hypothetical protein